jgi:hypothetical protein
VLLTICQPYPFPCEGSTWTPSTCWCSLVALQQVPLYPILRITTETGELFVDLAGAVYDTLPDARA